MDGKFLTERTVQMVIDGNMMESHPLEVGLPQHSPVSLILFTMYIPRLIQWVEKRDSGGEGLVIMDDVGLVATGNNNNQVIRKLEACTKVSIDWVE